MFSFTNKKDIGVEVLKWNAESNRKTQRYPVIQTVIFSLRENTKYNLFSVVKILLSQIYILLHYYFPIFHDFVYNKVIFNLLSACLLVFCFIYLPFFKSTLRLSDRKKMCLPVSVRRCFLSLFVLRIGCVILLWHFLGRPYNNYVCFYY